MSRELRQETLAEIEEELRSGEYAPLADRIHAAWERERVEIATKAATQGVKLTNEKFANLPICNAAAMREALMRIKHLFRNINLCEDILGNAAYAIADAALSAPPRNCDRFGGDPKMLRTAWFDWSGSPSGRNPDGTVKLTFGEWLIATATGENKA